MPKGKRNLMVADALRDEDDPEIDEADEPDEDEIPPVHVAAPEPALPASAPITMTVADLQSLIAQISTSNATNSASMAQVMAQSIAASRQPIPENDIDPGVSVLNPLGDQAHPRPGLKCKFAFGSLDAKTKQIQQAYTIESDDLAALEQIALNTLTPMHAVVQRLDGADMKVSVVPELDPVNDRVLKLTFVFPSDVIAKGSQVKNMLPGWVSLVAQMTGNDFAYLSKDMDALKWFMAEHRAGRYVSEREGVAA